MAGERPHGAGVRGAAGRVGCWQRRPNGSDASRRGRSSVGACRSRVAVNADGPAAAEDVGPTGTSSISAMPTDDQVVHDCGVEVVLGPRLVVRVRRGFDPGLLLAVVALLGAPRT